MIHQPSKKIEKKQSKEIAQIEKDITKKEPKKVAVKEESKVGLLIPKNKPLIFKKKTTETAVKSKYYSQKDFNRPSLKEKQRRIRTEM